MDNPDMKPLTEIYKGRFFAIRNSLNWRAKPVCEALNTIFTPESVMDVGCAIGDFVHYWKTYLNVPAYGIEGSENAAEYFMTDGIFILDLRKEIKLNFGVDLVTCFEVAEHIEPEYADQFLSNLVGFGNSIVMSAAGPGQGGHYHVNCQPKKYWVERMEFLGYAHVDSVVHSIRILWDSWRWKKEMSSYFNNLFYFERR